MGKIGDLQIIFFAVFLVLTPALISADNAAVVFRTAEDDSGGEDILPIVPLFEPFVREMMDKLEFAPELKEEIIGVVLPAANVDCRGCRIFYQFMETLVNRLPLTFEQLRDPIVQVCRVLLVREGLRGDIMCEGIIDGYGPAVWEIFEKNEMTVGDTCTYFNLCEPDEETLVVRREKRKEKRGQTSPEIPRLPAGRTKNLENTIKVAHISDIHVDELYVEGTASDCGLPVCCRGDALGQGSAGEWGNYGCNIPPRTMDAMLSYLNDLQPDMILYVGDSPPHTVWDETHESQLQVSRDVVDSLNRNLPGIKTYTTIGNHEMFPTSFYDPLNALGQDLQLELGKMYGPLADFTQEQYDTFHDAGYYTIMSSYPKLRILAFNSNYGYNANAYNMLTKDRDDYKRMMEFVEQTLASARQNGEKVILISHHPTGQQSILQPYSEWITGVHKDYSDIIVYHPLGHHHGNDFRLIVDDNGRVIGCQHNGPTLGTRSRNNPAFRLVYLDPDTYLPVDMDVHYLDVTEAMSVRSETPPIKLLYRFTEEFGVDDMTVSSLEKLACRLETDDDLVQRYRQLTSSLANTNSCGGSCRQSLLCTAWKSTWYDLNDCNKDEEYQSNCFYTEEPEPTDPTSAAAVFTINSLLLPFIYVALYFLK